MSLKSLLKVDSLRERWCYLLTTAGPRLNTKEVTHHKLDDRAKVRQCDLGRCFVLERLLLCADFSVASIYSKTQEVLLLLQMFYSGKKALLFPALSMELSFVFRGVPEHGARCGRTWLFR
mmetsp:Transcript_23628/g.33741  ORF Transcript_23628/g.33741 Transcript_23628/m.33741 type:complete len:120 (-) Transcript_23628:721-1080(-)